MVSSFVSSTNNAGPSTALASATDFDGFTPAGADDLYTAWAANRQPAPAGCGGVAYRKLAGVDDLYIARAANRQPAQAVCGVVAHRKLAGVDDLYTARAAIRQPAQAGRGVVAHRKLAGTDDLYIARAAISQPARAGCGVVAHRKLAGADDRYTARAAKRQPAQAGSGGGGAQEARWRGRTPHCTGCQPAAGSGRLLGGWRTGSSLARTTSTLNGPPTGSRIRMAAGGWPRWLSGGDTLLPARKSFCTRAAAWQPALTGRGWSRAASDCRHGSHTQHTVLPLQHIPPRGNPSLALIGPLTHLRL